MSRPSVAHNLEGTKVGLNELTSAKPDPVVNLVTQRQNIVSNITGPATALFTTAPPSPSNSNITLEVHPYRGYIEVKWAVNNEVPKEYDYIAIYEGDYDLQVGRVDPHRYWKFIHDYKYVSVSGRATGIVSSDTRYHSSSMYRAAYVRYDSARGEYVILTISRYLQVIFSNEGRVGKAFSLKCTAAKPARYWDYIALYDFKPSLGTEHVDQCHRNPYLYFFTSPVKEYIRNLAKDGLYNTETEDDGKTPYYAAYCTYNNTVVSILLKT